MSTDAQSAPVSKKMLWAGRILSALSVAPLLMSGMAKLAKPASVLEGFQHFGYPESVLSNIGIVELVSTVLYAIPQTSVFGAILLTGYLGGATATHVRVGDSFIFPVLLGVVVWVGLWLRDSRVRELLPLRS
jgi:hypothetical protein